MVMFCELCTGCFLLTYFKFPKQCKTSEKYGPYVCAGLQVGQRKEDLQGMMLPFLFPGAEI